jgi:hypothetical protein
MRDKTLTVNKFVGVKIYSDVRKGHFHGINHTILYCYRCCDGHGDDDDDVFFIIHVNPNLPHTSCPETPVT